MDMEDAWDDFTSQPLTITPARLRAKINKLLTSTDIKIGEFQKMLGVNANSYGKFMQTGTNSKYKDPWSATQNGTYHAAAFFFFKEDRLGKKALGKLRARGASAGASGTPAKSGDRSSLLSPTVATSVATKTKSATKTELPDVTNVRLESEHTWLTPSEVRKALQDLQMSHSTSVAGLARAAGVPYQSLQQLRQGRRRVGRQGQPELPSRGCAGREGAHRARQAQVGQAQGARGGGRGWRRQLPHGRPEPRPRPRWPLLLHARGTLCQGLARQDDHRLLKGAWRRQTRLQVACGRTCDSR